MRTAWGWPRAAILAALVALVLIVPATPAVAHGDRDVVDRTYPISAGETLTLPTEVHYHRLVARVDVHSGDGAVTLALVGPTAAERPLAGPGTTLRANTLVPCCDDQVWTDHTILVHNTGPEEVSVHVRIALLHDGVAVTGLNAEPGAAVATAWIPGLVFAILLPRLLRAPEPDAGPARPWQRRAMLTYGAMWSAALILALWGMTRYGGGPLAGSLAATADLPVIEGNLVSVHMLLSLVLIGLWVTTIVYWTAAARRHPDGHRTTIQLGLVIAAGSLVLGLTWAIEYGHRGVPALMTISTASYPLVGAWWLHRRAGAKDPEVVGPPGGAPRRQT